MVNGLGTGCAWLRTLTLCILYNIQYKKRLNACITITGFLNAGRESMSVGNKQISAVDLFYQITVFCCCSLLARSGLN